MSRVKVLYIAGFGRSGSTILGNVLNEVDGFFHIGEIQFLWIPGTTGNHLCGCQRAFQDCPVWSAVFDHAFRGVDAAHTEAMADLRWHHAPHNRHVAGALLGRYNLAVPRKLVAGLEKLYRSVSEVTGSEVIIDSSKFPSYAYILDRVPSIDLYLLHLVRDPRACAYSWARKKVRQDARVGKEQLMRQFGPVRVSLKWSFQNLAVALLGRTWPDRYIRMRYEDFATDPRRQTGRILEWIGEGDSSPVSPNREVNLRGNHTVWGNPSRLKTGPVKIRLDDKWKAKLDATKKGVVTALTGPLLFQYGYPVWA